MLPSYTQFDDAFDVVDDESTSHGVLMTRATWNNESKSQNMMMTT
jgi:hypothetical protein